MSWGGVTRPERKRHRWLHHWQVAGQAGSSDELEKDKKHTLFPITGQRVYLYKIQSAGLPTMIANPHSLDFLAIHNLFSRTIML